MRPLFVVASPPGGAYFANLLKVFKHVGIENLFAESLDVALGMGVWVPFAGLNVARLHAVSLSPIKQFLADELRSIVYLHNLS